MTNDEINKYIHSEIMGKCWHESVNGLDCYKCHNGHPSFPADLSQPNYCSDESPRRLLNEVVCEVATEIPLHILCQDVLTQMDNSWSLQPNISTSWLLTAPAEQIATACVEAHKALKEKE